MNDAIPGYPAKQPELRKPPPERQAEYDKKKKVNYLLESDKKDEDDEAKPLVDYIP